MLRIRKAQIADLAIIKKMYSESVKYFKSQNIEIWDDVYPNDFLEEDIISESLFIAFDEKILTGAFCLKSTNIGEDKVSWIVQDAKAIYIEKLCVNINYLNKKIGSALLSHAMKIAKKQNIDYLRLFVLDSNKPAINLYIKNKFVKASGVFNEKINDDLILYEYGFEIKV